MRLTRWCGLLAVAGSLRVASSAAQQVPVVPLPTSDLGLAPSAPLPQSKEEPLFLLNSRVLIGRNLPAINPADINKLLVYKGEAAPVNWRSLAPYGLIDVTIGRRLVPKSRSLAALRRQLKVSSPCRFEVDGRPLEDYSLRIATAAIAGLGVRLDAGSPVVTIQLVPYTPQPARPGIYVRGVAHW